MGASVPNKLRALRAAMKEAGVDAYLVPSTDAHQSEYVPECWQRRQWLSGFTGSVGDVVVTRDKAGLWTDGRYFIQADRELKGTTIKLFKLGVAGTPSAAAWIAQQLGEGQVAGVDPRLVSRPLEADLRNKAKAAGAKLKLLDNNLVDAVWDDQPPVPAEPIAVQPGRFAGATVKRKLAQLRKSMKTEGADAHVITALDHIAWLFNLRGCDVAFNPVAIAYAVITSDDATLFVDAAKVTPALRTALDKPAVQLAPYAGIGRALSALNRGRAKVWVDGRSANVWVLGKLSRCTLVTAPSPIWRVKSKKNRAEIEGAQRAHVRDGVAMVRFLHWLEGAVPQGDVTELSAADRLQAIRAEGDRYKGESFAAISGYAGHGAIIHYRVTPETDVPLRPKGIYLIDSGGQYLDGTTDITRTVLLGDKATREQKDRFTRVLKGNIAIARCRFPAGTAGRQIDALARLALWDAGLEYHHGTGHGVGAYLNVHEGPQVISASRCTGVPFEEGNILSNEPGYYKEGAYGIRIENLELVVKDDKLSQGDATFLRFEELTLCPIDTRLIEVRLLDKNERTWLNAYHARVRRELVGLLPPAEAKWLRRVTKAI